MESLHLMTTSGKFHRTAVSIVCHGCVISLSSKREERVRERERDGNVIIVMVISQRQASNNCAIFIRY